MTKRLATVSPEAIAQVVSGETVILDLKSEQYFSLDTVGTRVWQMLQETTDLDEVCRRMLDEYEVDEQDLRRDIDALIKSLASEGLITLAEVS